MSDGTTLSAAPGEGGRQGLTIPDHTLIRCIGEGAYGEVWMARNVLGACRAVKVVFRSSFKHRDPYEREFRGIQRFEPISRSCEGFVQILQVGRNDAQGFFYYVMELADALPVSAAGGVQESAAGGEGPAPLAESDTYVPRTLRAEIERQQRLSPADCVSIVMQLSAALEVLHASNLIHRDIKPANIIFVRGKPKLADIGLVTDLSDARSLVGTEGFMPPEGPNSSQADLYSLGKVLYEMVTGKDRKQFPEPATLLGSGMESAHLEELNVVILKACEPNPARRYRAARELWADLELIQAGRSVKRRRKVQRRLAWLQKAATIATAASVMSALGYLANRGSEAEYGLPKRFEVPASSFWRNPNSPRQFDVAVDQGTTRILFGDSSGLRVWDESTGATRPVVLQGLGDWRVEGGGALLARWSPGGREIAFRARRVRPEAANGAMVWGVFVADMQTHVARPLGPELADHAHPRELAWTPDGRTVTCLTQEGRIYTLTVSSGGRAMWVDTHLPPDRLPLFGDYSRDGRWLAVTVCKDSMGQGTREDRDVWIVPQGGGRPIALIDSPGFDGCPTWGGTDDCILFTSSGGRPGHRTWGLFKLSLDSKTGERQGSPVEVLSKPGQQLLHPKLMDGGRRVVYAGTTPVTQTWVAGGDARASGSMLLRGNSPALSPDGRVVYFVGETPEQRGIFAFDRIAGGSPKKLTDLTPESDVFNLRSLAVAPDGRSIALFAHDGRRQGIFLLPATGGAADCLVEIKRWDRIVPAWSPDGRWLAYTEDQRLCRVSVNYRTNENLAALYRWQANSLRWSPNGDWIAALGYEHSKEWPEAVAAFAVSVASRQVKRLTPVEENQYKEGLEWHPDGRRLTYMLYGPEERGASIRSVSLEEPGHTQLFVDQAGFWDYTGVWAPDGSGFFFHSSNLKSGEKGIHHYDAATGRVSLRLREGWLPVWSQDGLTCAWTVQRGDQYFEVIERR